MKVLFLSHYRNNDDIAKLSQNIALSMYAAEIEVASRHIDNDKPLVNPSEIMTLLEKTPLEDFTHCIQFLEPEYIVYSSSFEKNIAIVHSNYLNSKYIDNLNLVNEIWCFDDKTKEAISRELKNKILCANFSIKKLAPPILDLQSQLSFLYNHTDNYNIDDLSIVKSKQFIKENLSA